MTNFESLLSRHTGAVERSAFDLWQNAIALFDERRYTESADLLERILAESASSEDAYVGATGEASARLLLARAYYHSAQLSRAIETAQTVLDRDPSDGYAHLLLSRALERAGRAEEGVRHQRLAEAMGAA